MVVGIDDAYLVRAAQAGDDDAFEALVRRHQLLVYRVALRMLGNAQEAEDAAQDGLVGAWRALENFKADSEFSTWLYRIVTNRCLSMLRGAKPQEPLEDGHLDTAAEPPDQVEGLDRLRALKAAILALTPEQRAVLVLREFEDLSYDEIGRVLELSEAAVKGRLHRARGELADKTQSWR